MINQQNKSLSPHWIGGRLGNGSLSRSGLLVIAILLIVLLPFFSIFFMAVNPSENIWPHLMSTILPRAVRDTLLLMLGVGVLTFLMGTMSAWLVTMYEFPGHKLLGWALLLPFAMPTYINAYCYVEILDYSGLLQTLLRDIFNWESQRDYWFPEITSIPGAIMVMSFVLYPYVYLAARAAFLQQSVCVLDVARTLGCTHLKSFFVIALPLARPAIIAGLILALMECLNDIGTVEYFGVYTLTVSVYSTWLERSNLGGAAQIASVMLVFILALIIVEKQARRNQKYHHTSKRYQDLPITRLKGAEAWLATIACLIPIILGFLAPMIYLLQASIEFYDLSFTPELWRAAWHSISLAGLTALCAVSLALFISVMRRINPTPFMLSASRLAGTGYAIPGTVLAIGILIPLATFDNSLDQFMRDNFNISTGLLLSGSVFALIFAYTIRFLAISLGSIDAGYEKISNNLDAASRTLGRTSSMTFWSIHVPLLTSSIGTAALLVFVDTMKELPATLLLRPFNYDTLATYVYGFASLEQFEEAGLASIFIVLVGLIPVSILYHTIIAGRMKSRRPRTY